MIACFRANGGFLSLATTFVCISAPLGAAHAANTTTDYYRFENGTANGVATVIPDSVKTPRNGAAFVNNPIYTSDVPINPVPQTGAPNTLSLNLSASQALVFSYAFPFDVLKSATLEFWIKPASITAEQDLFWTTTVGGDTDRFLIGLAGGGVPAINYRDSNGVAHTLSNATISIPANQWSYIAFEKSGSTYKIFVNSSTTGGATALVSTVTDTNPNLPNGGGWTINGRGILNNPNNQFAGELDEVRLSSAALPTSKLLISPPKSR